MFSFRKMKKGGLFFMLVVGKAQILADMGIGGKNEGKTE